MTIYYIEDLVKDDGYEIISDDFKTLRKAYAWLKNNARHWLVECDNVDSLHLCAFNTETEEAETLFIARLTKDGQIMIHNCF